MDDLIKALQVFRKYGNPASPTHCSHDMLQIMISPEDVSEEDKVLLRKLSFEPHYDGYTFYSTRFGSA